MISLNAILPKIVDIKVSGYGEAITIPVLPLSYIQWQNATIGLSLPTATPRKLVVDVNKPPVEALDYNDAAYQRLKIDYENAVSLRRVAIALEGGGMVELQGKELDEQVELLRGMDAGLLRALYGQLEGMALKRSASWFPRGESLQDNHADLPGKGLDSGDVAKSDGA